MEQDYYKIIASYDGIEKAQEVFESINLINNLNDDKINDFIEFLNNKLMTSNEEISKLHQYLVFLKTENIELKRGILFLYKILGFTIIVNIFCIIYLFTK